VKFSINHHHHHHHRCPYKTHHDSTQTTCLPQAALRIWLASIESGKGGAGDAGTGSEHRSFPIEVLQLSVAEISSALPMLRDERCRPPQRLVRRERLAEDRCPASAGEGSGPSRPPAAGWGTGWGMEPGKPSSGLDWCDRKEAEQPPVVAHGKAGFILDGKSPGSAFRVTCLGRGCHHRRHGRGTSQGQRDRGFSRSLCSVSLRHLAGLAA